VAAHVPAPVHVGRICPRTAPLIVMHLPGELDSPHDWHWPAQSESQQNESTHFPDWQALPI
jgi:hypothetical protein